MSLDRYRLRAQLGAGADGMAYRALAEDGATEVEVIDLSRGRSDASRWAGLASRLRLAAELKHPAAIHVIELGLADDPPYAVLEWVGTTTLAAHAEIGRLKTSDETLDLIRTIAGALGAAHRLGLSHGRLAPYQVLLVNGAHPKLDFTGAQAGFPADPAAAPTLDGTGDGASHRTGAGAGLASDRAGDLHDLGSLIRWFLTGRAGLTEPDGTGAPPGTYALLESLARKLLADDPTERPTAHEIAAALNGQPAGQQSLDSARPDATGIWVRPIATVADPASPASSRMEETIDPGPSPRTPNDNHRLHAAGPGGTRLGRYSLLEKLGEGAQGVVFRALDESLDSVVAIKVLRTDRAGNADVLRRFRKEARLMAEANNPYVVNLVEYNEDEGLPYLVLEFVAGESVSALLSERTALDESTALAIMAGVARGLMEAHERGIVHRDIKPANILLLDSKGASVVPAGETIELAAGPTLLAGASALAGELNATLALTDRSFPRVKISDFGLARHVVDTESMAMTAAGALLGTPHYMAPEQWTGRAIDSRTDVYAMGATLFHLLAGRPPFVAETRDALCTQHCNLPPPRLFLLKPGVSEGVVRVVERALAKQPEDRYIDAGAMLRDLEALLHGQPADVTIHPRLPECDSQRILEFEFRWELESSPRELWPLVTNTDRLDRAIGFPPVRYTTRFEPGHGVRTYAEGRKAGMVEKGEEHPYEWVEPRRMGVLREYSEGPFRWMVSVVELKSRVDGGTSLFHRLRLEPSSWKVRVGSRWGVGVGLRKRLESVYRRIDATVRDQALRGASAAIDPFEEPVRLATSRRQRLEGLLSQLPGLGIDPGLVERLGEFLALGSPQDVARIRPLELAERWGLEPDQAVAACLQSAQIGLLELHWDLLCPVCRISCQVTDTLRAIRDHAHCEACHLDFNLDFANSIELIFRVHPEIRAADLGTYCVGGPAHSPHVLAQVRVAPQERIELELELPEGSYRVRGPQLPWTLDFPVRDSATIRRWEIDLASAAGTRPEAPPALRAGGQILILKSGHDRELLVRIERTASRRDALTAARVASLALFRELFPGEVLAPGQLAAVSTATLLATALDPAQADALYEELGDARAFNVIHEHFERLGDAIRHGGGAVVKTMGESVLAAFSDVTAAVRTALELPAKLAGSEATRPLRLRAGVHRGRMLAATLNDQLDYFGTTTRQTTAILQYARGDELVLTRAVASDPEVGALLSALGIEGEVVPTDLAGHPHLIRVNLVSPRAAQREQAQETKLSRGGDH